MDNTPLRILEVITPSHYSGAERVMTYLSGEFVRLGHEVLVVTKPLPQLEAQLAARGVPCRVLPLSGKYRWRAGRALLQVVREFRPQVVHTHLSTATRWGTWAAHREGLPCVALVHGMTSPFYYRRADLLTGPSASVREYLLARGFAPERVKVIHNGLDPAFFEGLPAVAGLRAELQLPPGAPVIGVVAHLSPRKGHEILFQAMARLAEAHPTLLCLCLGRGDPGRSEALERLAARLGLGERVRLLGYREDATALTQLFDIAVLPSIVPEGLPTVLLEAAYLGRPGVASDAGGTREVVEDGVTGLLVPPGDPVALAAALDRLLRDPDLRARMGEAARLRAHEHFTLRAQAEATLAAFRAVLQGGAA